MTVRELIDMLEFLPDDQLDIIIRIPHVPIMIGNGLIHAKTKYYDIHDIEDWSDSNHYEILIDDNEINTDCTECNGYGKIEEIIPEYTYADPPSEPLIELVDCPNCNGEGYFEIDEFFKQQP